MVIQHYLTNAKDFSSWSHATALKAVTRLENKVEVSLPTALLTHVCSFTVYADRHSWWSFLATATSTLIGNYQSVLETLQHVQHLTPCSMWFSLPSPIISGLLANNGKLTASLSQTIFKKIGFLEEHSLHIINVSWIFLHPFAKFLSTLKRNTKIWLYTGGERRHASRVSYFSLGISFQWLCQSRSNPPVVIVLPSPKWYLTAWMNKSA